MVHEHIESVKVRVLPDNRVSRREAAKVLNRAPKTLADWSAKGWGPRPTSVGGRIFYRYDEVLAVARGEQPVRPEAA